MALVARGRKRMIGGAVLMLTALASFPLLTTLLLPALVQFAALIQFLSGIGVEAWGIRAWRRWTRGGYPA